MKNTKDQLAFIEARAEGKSYRTIEKDLNISRGTCSKWEKLFREEIAELKQEYIEELYTSYNMKREARIKSLGNILQKIDQAIDNKDLEALPADKLLDLRIKYSRELKEEYIEPVDVQTDNTLDGILELYNQLFTELKAGACTASDVKTQLSILDAKRETIDRIASEKTREEGGNMFTFDFSPEYQSKVIRH